MRGEIRYAHTNLVAQDWRRLAQFYVNALGCAPVPPERDHHGPWFEDLTGLPDIRAQGMHLRLPGHGSQGPTLEIFTFNHMAPRGQPPAIHRPGFAHLAFEVDDVDAVRQRILEHGGADLGQIVTHSIPDAGALRLVYMTDPEGNIVELQRWLDRQ